MAETRYRAPESTTSRLTLAHQRLLAGWADILDPELHSYVRLTENARTVQWLADAGLLDLNNPLVRFEVRFCRNVIWCLPKLKDSSGSTKARVETDLPKSGRISRHSERPAPRSLPPPLAAPPKRSVK